MKHCLGIQGLPRTQDDMHIGISIFLSAGLDKSIVSVGRFGRLVTQSMVSIQSRVGLENAMKLIKGASVSRLTCLGASPHSSHIG